MRVTAQTKNVTRQRILAESKKLFAKDGFDPTTTRDIARVAQIGVGTLFNYFPTKESIVECLVTEASAHASVDFSTVCSAASAPASDIANNDEQSQEPLTLEEELFAHVAAVMRKLKPYRKYLVTVLETALSPLDGENSRREQSSLKTAHLETVSQILSKHGQHERLSAITLQLYWTLYTGVLAFWAKDRSPRQEDTLALLDQSVAMFVGWLSSQADCFSNNSET
jgi:AcrR family transcriptional regulator